MDCFCQQDFTVMYVISIIYVTKILKSPINVYILIDRKLNILIGIFVVVALPSFSFLNYIVNLLYIN